ncbi:GIY-YIG nuclease family protein [Clostridium perfringens]|uniref:GIY-YIG nuclease family protein n=1 Tax=Clostridium perfringens TaxID=1502 RepID=UPI002341BA8C|nr:GIY-YIG nuclease family protein [Clostridium perfringens]MDC4245524.1 GIY-YIG nuclease family protein [Clostridium perfringens]
MNKARYGIIYKITNTINNKIYIGQTVNNFNKRYGANLEKFTHNQHLKNAIRKYGIDKFKIEKEFDVAYSKEELDFLEDYYIRFFNTTNQKYGYNKMYGGSNGLHTFETKQKISKIQEKINGKKVICITTNRIFNSISKASRCYNINGECIAKCCQRKISQTHNLQWLYYEDYLKGVKPLPIKDKRIICVTTQEIFETMDDIIKKYSNLQISGISQCCSLSYASHGELADGTRLQWLHYDDYLKGIKPKEIIDTKVICIQTKKVFNNSKEAGEYYNIDYSHMYNNCKTRKGYCGQLPNGIKLQWLYYRDYLNGVRIKEIKDNRVICINNLEVFASAGEAANKYHLDKSCINKCCNNKRKSCGKDINGNPLKWMRYENYINIKNKESA